MKINDNYDQKHVTCCNGIFFVFDFYKNVQRLATCYQLRL